MPCLHRNGEITGYTVVARTSGEDERVVNVNDGNARSATVSGLTPNTQYTVSVAAVNSAGTGPASEIDIMTCKYCVCGWETAQTHIECVLPVYFYPYSHFSEFYSYFLVPSPVYQAFLLPSISVLL